MPFGRVYTAKALAQNCAFVIDFGDVAAELLLQLCKFLVIFFCGNCAFGPLGLQGTPCFEQVDSGSVDF